jgi:hypothetical protein
METQIKSFIKDCTCNECGSIQPYIWRNSARLCKRCEKRRLKHGIDN